MNIQNAKNYLSERISPSESFDALLRYPRFLEIETVNACNARCPMCTIDDWQRNTPVMRDDLFRKIADDIISHKDEVTRVSLYRDGEPLLDKKLPERISILKRGGVREVAIATNGSLLNERNSRELLQAGIDVVIISIDSLVKEIFESIRLRLNFEEVIANAKRFAKLRDKLNPSTRIWMRMIRQESNFAEWEAYQAYWTNHLGPQDRIYYHNIFNWGGQLKNFKSVSENPEKSLPCVALWSLMVIFGDGRVPLCNVDYNNEFPTGSVVTNSIEEIWTSKVMADRRALHLSGRKSEIGLCTECNVWEEMAQDGATVTSKYM